MQIRRNGVTPSRKGLPENFTGAVRLDSFFLAEAPGRVKTREQLLDSISDRNFDVFDRSIDVHISALRKKLGDDAKNPHIIRTVRAAGYMMMNPDEETY